MGELGMTNDDASFSMVAFVCSQPPMSIIPVFLLFFILSLFFCSGSVQRLHRVWIVWEGFDFGSGHDELHCGFVHGSRMLYHRSF